MAGRKRKPDHLKIVAGTDQPSRMNPLAPIPSPALPSPPEWLNERASDWFRKVTAILDGMGIASADHVDMLSLAASRWDEMLECTGIIEDLGRTYSVVAISGSIMFKSRPEVAQRNEAMRHLQSLLAEFGLSPATLAKVSAPGRSEVDEFADFA